MACRAEYATEFNPITSILPSLKKIKQKTKTKQNRKQTKIEKKTQKPYQEPQNQQPKNLKLLERKSDEYSRCHTYFDNVYISFWAQWDPVQEGQSLEVW